MQSTVTENSHKFEALGKNPATRTVPTGFLSVVHAGLSAGSRSKQRGPTAGRSTQAPSHCHWQWHSESLAAAQVAGRRCGLPWQSLRLPGSAGPRLGPGSPEPRPGGRRGARGNWQGPAASSVGVTASLSGTQPQGLELTRRGSLRGSAVPRPPSPGASGPGSGCPRSLPVPVAGLAAGPRLPLAAGPAPAAWPRPGRPPAPGPAGPPRHVREWARWLLL
jgi:hypothetical protein